MKKEERKLTEEEISFLEEQIPEIAEGAFKKAYWNALTSGSSVLEAENGNLVEVHPDGTRKIIKKISPPISMKVGQKFEIP